MAVLCPVCAYDFVVPLGHLYQCLSCSAHFDIDGAVHDTNDYGTAIAEPTPEPTPEEVTA